MKRKIALAVVLLVALSSARAQAAAGSVTVTGVRITSSVVKQTIAWTSDASGNVNGNSLGIAAGDVFQIIVVPGAVAPTDLYDMVINTPSGTIDILQGAGANLSTSTSKGIQLYPAF